MKKELLHFWTLASLLILLAMVFGLVLPLPFQRQNIAQATDAWLAGYYYRTPVTITGASTAGGNYTVGPIIVYRGTATTLENGSWTVNGNSYTSRFSFTVQERSGGDLTHCAIKVSLDTQSLVEGGYCNASANGDEIEFTTSGGSVLNYWLDTATFGAPDCTYYVKSNLTANSTASFYCYLNQAATTISTSFSLANTFSSISVYTAASVDDCAYYYADGQHFATNDIHVQAGSKGASAYDFSSGMRWQVNIPQYSDIISATLGITANAGGSADCATLINVEYVDWAAAYSTPANYISRVTNHSYLKSIAWNITGVWTTDVEYTSPDIRVPVQELVNRNSWAANNYLAMQWEDITTPTSGAYRYGYSYDGTVTSTKRPHLTIYYRTPISVEPLTAVPVLRANAVQALDNTVNWPNDIRVTASDGTTELPFYLDTKYDNYVKLWVKDTVDDLSTGQSATIYVYYGKSGASSGADIAGTFSFGDDFTDAGLDTTNWAQTNTVGYGSAIAYNSMWLRPRYPAQRYVGTYDRTYITWINNAGELKILAYDHTQKSYIGGTFGTTIATGWFGNLYDSATILAIPSGADAGKILVFARKFDSASSRGYGIYVYRSDLAEDISSWSLRKVVEPDNYALYPQPVVLSTGSIALFYMATVGSYRDTCYVISTDGGDTWGARTILIAGDGEGVGKDTYIYPCVAQSGKETHVCFTTWNNYQGYVGLHYLYNDNDLDITRWMKRNGTSCGNLTAAGLITSVCDKIQSGHKPYVMDLVLDSSKNPYIAYVTYQAGSLTLYGNWAYYSASAGWVHQTTGIGREIDSFQEETRDPYSTGISIDPKDPTHIFMGVRTATATDIQELHTTDNGLTWTKVADITSGSTDLCYQPYCVRNYSADLKLVFNINLAFTNDENWTSYLCAYPLTVNKFHSVVLRGKASSRGVINSKNALSGNYTFVSQVLQINAAPGDNTWFTARASTGNYNDTVAKIYGDASTNYQEVVQSARTGQTTQTQTGLHLKTGFYQDWKIKWLGQNNATVFIDGISRFTITTCTGNATYLTMLEGAKANTYTFVDYMFTMPAVSTEPTWTVGSQEASIPPPTPRPTPTPTPTPMPTPTPTPNSTLYSTADSRVAAQFPTDNFGTDLNVGIQAFNSSNRQRTLAQFDLSSIPAGSTISSASFSVYYFSYYAAGLDPVGRTYYIYRNTGPWTETAVNWNNQPAYTTSQGASVAMPGGFGWVSWNVKDIVQSWVNGTANYGFLMMDSNETPGTINKVANSYSKEYAGSTYAPRLLINYTAPAPTPTPTPTPMPISSPTPTPAESISVTGTTREVNGNILPGVTITIGGIGLVVSDQNGQFQIMVAATGNDTVVAHKDGFRDRTQSIGVAGLGPSYSVTCNFQGQSGLIPKAPDMWYALDCVSYWLYPPNPDLGLDIWTALDVINAWLYPLQ